ncbi:hypothetical protein FTUN_8643 [Frigoriglobus tundricola]|uniref:Uncharacterized protein n=1 Tax=Frigoriglobus tundricola TaxID=2774151 RepID=A0A6M5Z5M8_9BACT|nr:hypothetical protein FTUN_8643 [Frigoriglobus tundricola]
MIQRTGEGSLHDRWEMWFAPGRTLHNSNLEGSRSRRLGAPSPPIRLKDRPAVRTGRESRRARTLEKPLTNPFHSRRHFDKLLPILILGSRWSLPSPHSYAAGERLCCSSWSRARPRAAQQPSVETTSRS